MYIKLLYFIFKYIKIKEYYKYTNNENCKFGISTLLQSSY